MTNWLDVWISYSVDQQLSVHLMCYSCAIYVCVMWIKLSYIHGNNTLMLKSKREVVKKLDANPLLGTGNGFGHQVMALENR